MYILVKGIEEIGKTVGMGYFFTEMGINRGSPIWNGMFTLLIHRGYSPFKSGFISGYLTHIDHNPIRPALTGAAMGATIAITGRTSQYIKTLFYK
ncbi:hypothetical protein NEOKW01_1330 [Nematocida sp. AWRm80]|nr:hypothetical protein NEOKW01_1330 [Nematocida sp. AWRm80]